MHARSDRYCAGSENVPDFSGVDVALFDERRPDVREAGPCCNVNLD